MLDWRGIKHEVLCFRLWREGASVGWTCTAAELADAVGCDRSTARRIAAERDWPIAHESRSEKPEAEVDKYMERIAA